jgi:DNA-binding NarL/FixJ family response regulator
MEEHLRESDGDLAMEVKILLADDHDMIRSGLRALLQSEEGFTVVAEAKDGRTAVAMVRQFRPHVVVMDVRMPDLNGLEATRQTLALTPDAKVIGLSGNSDQRAAREMLAAGALGYVRKEAAFEELVKAIRAVMDNKIYVSPSVAGPWMYEAAADSNGSRRSALSPREREVLQLLAEGKATKEVAVALNVSVKTAETHRRNLMDKLQIDSVAELTKYAIREGITEL